MSIAKGESGGQAGRAGQGPSAGSGKWAGLCGRGGVAVSSPQPPGGFLGLRVAASGSGVRFLPLLAPSGLTWHSGAKAAAMSSVQVLYPPKIHHSMLSPSFPKEEPAQGKCCPGTCTLACTPGA